MSGNLWHSFNLIYIDTNQLLIYFLMDLMMSIIIDCISLLIIILILDSFYQIFYICFYSFLTENQSRHPLTES